MSLPNTKTRQRKHYPYLIPHSTRWLDNDVYAHMNNSIYYHLFDTVVNHFLITHCSLHPPTSQQIGLVVHSSCDYYGPVGFPSTLELGMRVIKLGKSSVTYECAVFESGVEEVKAVGTFVHVYVDRDSRRPHETGLEVVVREKLDSLVVKRQPKL